MGYRRRVLGETARRVPMHDGLQVWGGEVAYAQPVHLMFDILGGGARQQSNPISPKRNVE